MTATLIRRRYWDAGTTIDDRPERGLAGTHSPTLLLELADELAEHGFEAHRQIAARAAAAGAHMTWQWLPDGRAEATCALERWCSSTNRTATMADAWAQALHGAVHRGVLDRPADGPAGRPDEPC
jgi:hypothetical protein